MTRQVVLVPGLWMPAAAMAFLGRALRAYEPRVFTYRGRDCHERNIEALARFAGDGASLIGHSLGGVLIYDMLARHPEVRADAVVLLGAPVRGFCYPYGKAGAREVAAVRAAGYRYACAVGRSTLDSRYAVPRVFVGDRDGAARLAAKWLRHRIAAGGA